MVAVQHAKGTKCIFHEIRVKLKTRDKALNKSNFQMLVFIDL